jgi:hypothetical protein
MMNEHGADRWFSGDGGESEMRVEVVIAGETRTFEMTDDRPAVSWLGPRGLDRPTFAEAARAALESPLGLPPLRQVVVPGDRVAIAIGPGVPGLAILLEEIAVVLEAAGVSRSDISAVLPPGEDANAPLPDHLVRVRHDPDDRANLAYLATTAEGRRIYLDRALTDADVVLAVGTFRPESADASKVSGPDTGLFPGLSDAETRRDRTAPADAAEVAWLLGSLFQVGARAGIDGPAGVIAGSAAEVRAAGERSVEREWTFHAPETADLVIAGVGTGERPSTLADVAAALTNASRLVRPGGRIAVLSRATAEPGPAVERLRGHDDPRLAASSLRGLEGAEDYPVALALAHAIARADVYVSGPLDPDLIEDLGLVPLGRDEEAFRLANLSASCLIFSPAERARTCLGGATKGPVR